MTDDIVITGMGIVSPIGCGETTFWESLCSGRSAAAPVDGLNTTDLSRKIACQVREPMDTVGGVGRASKLAVTAARQAVSDARIDPSDLDPTRTYTIVGTTMGETEFIEEGLDAQASDWLSSEQWSRILTGRPGSISAHVRSDLKLGGYAADLYGACAAGNMAIALARRHLLDGRCDVALAGGADGFSKLAFIGFMRLRVMAAEVCRPFDQQRDGLLVGEGATIFVLERESTARARGAVIRARVLGAGLTCESYHPTRPDPNGEGLARATAQALRGAGLTPSDIDYICAHGTGTPQNDAIEVTMMDRCFPKGVCFSSIKALTGHTMGAAAAMEAGACVLSLQHQTLIPTWHLDTVLQPCSLDAITGSTRVGPVRYVVNNSAGFGGYNSSLVLAVA
ncbi:MAG: beta-ketoacyl-[acyl-carrier-protein] synthase family protein [Planctomycetes bacterium]|nr:beta-ketoacyl-[acyl-carrier-protein] synthase family protein [Planctomycetota bacterium]